MHAREAVNLIDPTASIYIDCDMYFVRGIFPFGSSGCNDQTLVEKWETGLFPTSDAAWHGAFIFLQERNTSNTYNDWSR